MGSTLVGIGFLTGSVEVLTCWIKAISQKTVVLSWIILLFFHKITFYKTLSLQL
ncbi:hypothetical protein [Holospora curviuscula]|uniref:Uncharacterized protein n=1 Tax=Holospora curviuscula TaxID=1082868 RepID=A0A2S5R959_9PROT|nr:hypothetical protein [Holospora curviuscula]PPE03854.1 hypothetical protein HCUR_00631 [Holospora curviuscula]